jgi:hypothetical protein
MAEGKAELLIHSTAYLLSLLLMHKLTARG